MGQSELGVGYMLGRIWAGGRYVVGLKRKCALKGVSTFHM